MGWAWVQGLGGGTERVVSEWCRQVLVQIFNEKPFVKRSYLRKNKGFDQFSMFPPMVTFSSIILISHIFLFVKRLWKVSN